MDRPQQPEMERSGHTPIDQESRGASGPAAPLEESGRTGRLPPANRPGHHPPREEDKPVWAGGTGRRRDGGLTSATKTELMREAKRLGIHGRSRMTKRELADALSSRER